MFGADVGLRSVVDDTKLNLHVKIEFGIDVDVTVIAID